MTLYDYVRPARHDSDSALQQNQPNKVLVLQRGQARLRQDVEVSYFGIYGGKISMQMDRLG